MSKLLPALFLGCILTGAVAIARLTAAPDPLAYSQRLFEQQQAQRAAQEAAEDAERLRPVVLLMRSAWYVALAMAPFVALAVALDAYRRRAAPLVRPDARGLLPVARIQVETGQLTEAFTAALAAYHHTQALAATHQPVAERLTLSVRPDRGVQALSSPQNEPQSLPAPPALPEVVRWQDVAGQVRPGYFAYGLLADGQVLQRPITTAYHTLFHGETRSGKTTGIHSLLVQAHHLARRHPTQLYMIDVKRELGAVWGRSPLLQTGVQHDASAAADLITELVHGDGGVLARYRLFEEIGQSRNAVCTNVRDYERLTNERPPLVFVVADELNALLELARGGTQFHQALTILLQTGAAAGFYVIAGAQYLSAKVFGRDATQQFVSRAHFGAYDATALRMLFNQAPAALPTTLIPPGRGYIRVQGQPAPLPFQGVYCDEATILDAQRVTSAGNSVTPRVPTASTAGERAETPGVPSVEPLPAIPVSSVETPTEPPIAETDRAAIIALAKAGISRREIGRQVYGVVGGRAYERVKATLDAAGL